MQRYEIAFTGRMLAGAEVGEVKSRLAQVFQADGQRIEALFSGRRVVIKNNLDERAAQHYRMALERAGALVDVRLQMPDEVPASATDTSAVNTTPSLLQVTPRDEYMAAFRAVRAPDFGLAPLGADLQDESPAAVAPHFDLSALSLLPLGCDLGQRVAALPAVLPNIAHLRVLD